MFDLLPIPRRNTQLVDLPVLVRDKKGALVQNLARSEFALSVDGYPQTIRYFDRDNDLPLTLGLLVMKMPG